MIQAQLCYNDTKFFFFKWQIFSFQFQATLTVWVLILTSTLAVWALYSSQAIFQTSNWGPDLLRNWVPQQILPLRLHHLIALAANDVVGRCRFYPTCRRLSGKWYLFLTFTLWNWKQKPVIIITTLIIIINLPLLHHERFKSDSPNISGTTVILRDMSTWHGDHQGLIIIIITRNHNDHQNPKFV